MRSPETRIATVLVDMEAGSRFFEVTSEILEAHQLRERCHIPKAINPLRMARARKAIEAQLGLPIAEIPLIVTFGYHRPVSRYFCNHATGARLVFYEEGLRTYVDQAPMLGARSGRRIDNLWSLADRSLTKLSVDPAFAHRAVEYTLLLSDQIAPPPSVARHTLRRLPAEALRRVLNDAKPAAARELRAAPPADRQAALIVGQYYAQLKQMDEEKELAIYVDAANTIVQRGLVPVWRGHIRERDLLYERLKQRCSALRNFAEFVDDPSYPLEFHVDFFSEQCACVVSLASSALFYLNYLYDIPAYTLLDAEMTSAMQYPHKDACAFALQHVSSFHDRGDALGDAQPASAGAQRAALLRSPV